MKRRVMLALAIGLAFIGATLPPTWPTPITREGEGYSAVAVREPDGLWVIQARLVANTPDVLATYRQARLAAAKALLDRPWPGPLPVQITFRSPLSFRAVQSLLQAGHLEFDSVAGVLAPDFAWGGWADPREWTATGLAIDPPWLERIGWSGDPWEAPLVTHLTGWLHRPEDLRFWLERPEVELVDTLGAELEAWVRRSLPYRLGGGRLGYAHRMIPTLPWIEYARFPAPEGR
ncbi:hypothetical protein [Thermoflexus sp.]|uniref:hypothetical protein n=1 Tax=Thermoflexus sp. TaxID=1969742 RepID=UPI00176CEFE9|nr:hypothetical protein [Thermoflexus sp.]